MWSDRCAYGFHAFACLAWAMPCPCMSCWAMPWHPVPCLVPCLGPCALHACLALAHVPCMRAMVPCMRAMVPCSTHEQRPWCLPAHGASAHGACQPMVPAPMSSAHGASAAPMSTAAPMSSASAHGACQRLAAPAPMVPAQRPPCEQRAAPMVLACELRAAPMSSAHGACLRAAPMSSAHGEASCEQRP